MMEAMTLTHPTGARVVIEPDGDGWKTTGYPFKNGPALGSGFLTTDKAEEGVRNLQADGWVRVVPGWPEPPKKRRW